jgi:hypothetical protein
LKIKESLELGEDIYSLTFFGFYEDSDEEEEKKLAEAREVLIMNGGFNEDARIEALLNQTKKELRE